MITLAQSLQTRIEIDLNLAFGRYNFPPDFGLPAKGSNTAYTVSLLDNVVQHVGKTYKIHLHNAHL